MCKISVIIPCYNQSEFLLEAIESVLNSTYKNLEIIVVNDGSTDKTAEEIKNILPKNVILINQENKGVCLALNNGIEKATGKYILPLDADDKISDTYIEKAITILENNPDIGIVYCDAYFFGLKHGKWNLASATITNMLLENRIFKSGIFRKSKFLEVGGYKKEMEVGCEDWDLWLSILETGVKVYKIPEGLFFYRIHANERTKKSLNALTYLKIRLNIIKFHNNLYKKFGLKFYILLSMMFCKNLLSFFYKKIKLIYKIYKCYLICINCKKPLIYGITKQKRSKKIIVSLTSFPERINEIHLTINSLLHQSLKPDEIILWLSEEEFINKEKDLPTSLTRLKKYGLTINFYSKNIKSYKKIIPTLKKYPNDIIILADDDLYYKKNWLKLLYLSYKKNPNAIHCHRLYKICFDKNNKILPYSYWQKSIKKQFNNEVYLATSGAGVLIPNKKYFYKDITNEELFMQLAPNADDLWMWAMAILNNTKMQLVKNNITDLIYLNPKREYGLSSGTTLYKTNSVCDNDRQLAMILDYYPTIEKQILKGILNV